MVGITSYGAYVPPTRLPLGALGGREAREGGPEKAVAWNDEDAVTMGVAAGLNCLRGLDRDAVDAIFFATTTHAFREKQGAALIARALDLRRDIHSADIGSSLRAGTSALRAARDAVAAGSNRCVLVIASDCRMGAPGSGLEANSGDGAAAFLVGEHDVIAELDAAFSVNDEIIDVWRNDGDAFTHSWEDRFVIQEGYTPRSIEAANGAAERAGRALGDYGRVALYAPDARSHAGVCRGLGLAKEQVVAPLFGQLGNAGAAFAPLQLAAALETAQPGESLLLVGYGDGADALSFTIGDAVTKLEPRRGVTFHLARKRTVAKYESYLKARSLETSEWEAAAGPGLSATIHFRERDDNLSFRGQQCTQCQGVQFPAQRVCAHCYAKDQFVPLRLSDKVGKVVTFTFDFFFPTPNPPTIVSIIDVEGARIHMQVVDCTPREVQLGMPVDFSFRRIHQGGGRPNYYWKAVPQIEGPG